MRVDNTDPTGSVTAPADAANVRGTVSLTSNSTDAGGSGVDTVQFQRSPIGAGTWTNQAPSWNTTLQSDGQYDLRVLTTDNAGNSFASAPITVRVDNTNPTGSITAPADAANVRGTVSLTSNSADGGSGVATVQFQRSPIGAGTWTNQAASWNTTLQTDGQYDLRVLTTDNSGNSHASATITVRVDNTDPTGSVTAPADAANVRNTISLTSNSADTGGSGVDTVTFQRSPAGAGTWTNQAASWNTTAQADGPYDLRVVTTDNAGNSFTSTAITVLVDNTNPTGSVTNPAAAADIRGTVALASNSADAGGSGVDTITFQRSPAGAGTWTNQAPSWNTTLQSDGQYDLRVLTTDLAGNSATSAAITVRVDNTDPTGSVTAPSDNANVRGHDRPDEQLRRRRWLGCRDGSVPALTDRRRHLDEPGRELEHDSADRRPVRPPRRDRRQSGNSHTSATSPSASTTPTRPAPSPPPPTPPTCAARSA